MPPPTARRPGSSCKRGRFDVVVTDLKMPNLDGIELLKRIKQGPLADMEVDYDDRLRQHPVAVEAMRLGAFDFVTKPFRNDDVFPLLGPHRAPEAVRRRRGPGGRAAAGGRLRPVDRRPVAAMGRVKHMIQICARTDANVLLCGETGVGKDLVAGVIHRLSPPPGFPYVKVGCTLFPPQLIESELYGHEKGSFTGADQRRKGRFDLAEGGTLYLDDVDDIPLGQQSKLLRAIEEKVFERVGGTAPIKADVRIIASTKQHPPGQDRRGDLPRGPLLPARRAAGQHPAVAGAAGGRARCWPPTCCEQIASGQDVASTPRPWKSSASTPGPAMSANCPIPWSGPTWWARGHVTAELLAAEMGGLAAADAAAKSVPPGDFQAAMDQTESELLSSALRTAGGNKTAAAAALGMKPSTFRDKLAKHGLG